MCEDAGRPVRSPLQSAPTAGHPARGRRTRRPVTIESSDVHRSLA